MLTEPGAYVELWTIHRVADDGATTVCGLPIDTPAAWWDDVDETHRGFCSKCVSAIRVTVDNRTTLFDPEEVTR